MWGAPLLYATRTKMDVLSVIFPLIVAGLVILTRRVDVDMAKLVNTVVIFLFDGRIVKDFHIGTIQFFPFVLSEFKVTILETKGNPEVTVEIGQMRLILTDPLKVLKIIIACTIDFNRFREYIMRGGGEGRRSRVKWVRVRFTDFKVSCKNLIFSDVLKSSDRKSDKPRCVYSRKPCDRWDISVMQTVLSVLEVSFHDMNFDFKMPLHNCEITGGTAFMHIYFCRHRSKFPGGVLGIIDMANSKLAIAHGPRLAFVFVNATTNMMADLYLPSGFHEVFINCHDGNKVIMNIQPFLAFYEKEMGVEDDMVELKMITGADTNGKMCTIAVAFAVMNVLMFDDRKTERGSGVVIDDEINDLDSSEISVHGMAAMIKRYFYGSDGKIIDTLTTDVMSTGMKCDSLKEIGATVERMDWVNTNHAVDERMFIEKITAMIVKKNFISSSHVDTMSMHVSTDNLFFNRVSQNNLEWLFVLQELSEKLPESRFAQPKIKDVRIYFDNFFFSICPDDVVDRTMADILNPPRSHADVKLDRVVSFLLKDLAVAAHSNACDISLYRVSIGESIFDAKMPWGAVEEEYGIGLPAASGGLWKADAVLGHLYLLKDYCVHFSMGPDGMLFDSFWSPSGVQVAFYSHSQAGGARKVNDFVKSNDLCVLWSVGQDMTVKMGSCDIYSNVVNVLFFQSCHRQLMGTIKKLTDHMKFVKEFPTHCMGDASEAPDTATAVAIPKLTIKLITSDPNGTLEVRFAFSSLNFSMRRLVSRFSWDSVVMSTNKCTEYRPFLVVKNGDVSTEHVTPSENNEDMPIRFDPYTRSEFTFETIDVVVSSSTGVGAIVDSLLRDQKIFDKASAYFKNKSYLQEGGYEIDKPDYSKMFIDMKIIRLVFDGDHDSKFTTNLCTIDFTGLKALLENAAQEEFIHSVIKTLDNIETGIQIPYGPYSGGNLNMTVDSFSIYVSRLKAPLLSLQECRFEGPLYSCAIINPGHVVDEETLAVVDIHKNKSELTISASREPSKVYAGLSISVQHWLLFLPETFLSIHDSFMKVVVTAMPQGKTDQSPLAWWDSLRFWAHGYLKVSIQKLDILQIASTEISDSLVAYTAIDEYSMYVDNKSIEMGGNSFGVFCRFSSDEDLSRVVDYTNLLNQFKDSVEEKVRDNQINKIIHIPDVKLICRHSRSVESLRATGQQIHHDVYSSSDLAEKDDMYSSFRLNPMSIDWNVGIVCGVAGINGGGLAGRDTNVSLNLRIDIIYRFCNVYLSNANTSEDENKVTKAAGNDGDDDDDDDIDQNTLYKERDSTVTVGSLVRSVNFQMHTPNLLVYSWQSDDNYEGIVFIQESMDIQFNLLNEVVIVAAGDPTGEGRGPVAAPLSTPPEASAAQRRASTKKSGVTFSEDLVRRGGEEPGADIAKRPRLASAGNATPSAGLALKIKVHLFFMEIDTAELFVRDGGVYDDAASDGPSCREPRTVGEITDRFSQVHRIAHAHSVRVKQSREVDEDNIVKKDAFAFSSRSQNLFHRLGEMLDALRILQSKSKLSAKFRNSIQPIPLPRSLNTGAPIRTAPHGLQLTLSNFLANHALLKPLALKPFKEPTYRSNKSKKSNLLDDSHSSKSDEGEIWSLKIVDVRLLWTLAIRDTLFRFVHKHLLTKEETFGRATEPPPVSSTKEKDAADDRQPRKMADSKPDSAAASSRHGKQKENAQSAFSWATNQPEEAKSSEARAMLRKPQRHPFAGSSAPAPADSASKGSSRAKRPNSARKEAKKVGLARSRKDKFDKYFKIELIDPQINFLDTKSLSSLILGFKTGILEGKRNMTSLCPDRHEGKRSMLQRKNDIRLQMGGVSAFTAPVEVSDDGNIQVHWKQFDFAADSEIALSRKVASSSLKLAIADFEIRAQYSFFLSVSARVASKNPYVLSDDDPIASFSLDLPVICLDIDSQQFYAILNVTKNLLLAPPPALSNAVAAEEALQEADEIYRDPELLERNSMKLSANKLDMSVQACRDEMKVYVEEVLKDFDNVSDLVRCVELFIGKATWKLRDDLESHSVLETGFIGVYAMFSSHKNKSSDTRLEIQRFWASDEFNLTLFDTVMVIDPELDSEPCMRCGQTFTMASNAFDACKFHAFSTADAQNSQIEQFDPTTKEWPCCGRFGEFAEPCEKRPHKCKELMFNIRAAVNPPARIEDIDISILTNLEVSIFPGASYNLNLRVSKQIADVIHRYFSLGNDPVGQAKSDSTSSQDGKGQVTASDKYGSTMKTRVQHLARSSSPQRATGSDGDRQSTKVAPTVVPATPLVKRGQGDQLVSHYAGVGDGDVATSAIKKTNAAFSKLQSMQLHAEAGAGETNEGKKVKRQEGVYIKYLRIGDINIELNTKGFPINLDRNRAVVDPFTCKGVVVDWHTLIRNVEIHAALSVFNNAASNSFSRLNNFVFGSGASGVLPVVDVKRSAKGEVSSEKATKREKAAALLGITR